MAVALAVVFVAGRESGHHAVQAEDKRVDDSRLKQLLKERLEIRKEIVEAMIKDKTVSPHDIAEARAKLLEAELEACETKAQRIAILEKILASEKASYKVLMAAKKMGQCMTNELMWPIPPIEAEIALEREKLKP